MGTQASNPEGLNYDPEEEEYEGPPHEVELSPYFLSKSEMTQGHLLRLAGVNPSTSGPHAYALHWNRERRPADLLHPVEQVPWTQASEMMRWLGLSLPSEAQWECGARAGSDTAWWTGADPASLAGAGNPADAYGKLHGGGVWTPWERNLDDGHMVHAPVGSFRANRLGLHDVAGSVWEWCRDAYSATVYKRARGRDPVVPPGGTDSLVHRGGSHNSDASEAHSAARRTERSGYHVSCLGLRPSKGLMP